MARKQAVKAAQEPKVQMRVVWSEDEYGAESLDYLKQWDTEEKYKGNEVHVGGKDGRKVPWEEYKNTYGNVDNYVALCAHVEEQCDKCGEWHEVMGASICGVGYYMTDHYRTGTYNEESVDRLEEYQQLVSRDLFHNARG
jgi:hypothetical protein